MSGRGLAARGPASAACCLGGLRYPPFRPRPHRRACRLQDGGLQGLLYEPIVQRWIAGSAEQAPQTAAQAVAAAQAAKAAKEGVAARRTALVAALAAEGLGAYAPQQNMYYGYGELLGLAGWGVLLRCRSCAALRLPTKALLPTSNAAAALLPTLAGYGRSQVPGLDAYVDGGEGSQAAGAWAGSVGGARELHRRRVLPSASQPAVRTDGGASRARAPPHAVLEAARGLRAAEQARQQRREAATEALAGEGLGHHAYSSLEGWHSWVEGGIGSVEALVAAAREMQQVAEARAARRAHIEELLAAEGLQGQAWLPDVQVYVLHGTDGSEEAALEAARTAAAKEAASAERRAALEAALAVEGIPYNLVHHLDHVLGFVHDDLGTLESGAWPAAPLQRARAPCALQPRGGGLPGRCATAVSAPSPARGAHRAARIRFWPQLPQRWRRRARGTRPCRRAKRAPPP